MYTPPWLCQSSVYFRAPHARYGARHMDGAHPKGAFGAPADLLQLSSLADQVLAQVDADVSAATGQARAGELFRRMSLLPFRNLAAAAQAILSRAPLPAAPAMPPPAPPLVVDSVALARTFIDSDITIVKKFGLGYTISINSLPSHQSHDENDQRTGRLAEKHVGSNP